MTVQPTPVPTVVPSVQPTPAPTAHELDTFSGAHDLNHRCISLGYQQASSARGTWECRGKANASSGTPTPKPLAMNAACAGAYGTGATALHKDLASAES